MSSLVPNPTIYECPKCGKLYHIAFEGKEHYCRVCGVVLVKKDDAKAAKS